MKRSGPPERKTPLAHGDKPLRASAGSTKAFVERGRERARERARDRPRTSWEAQALRGSDKPPKAPVRFRAKTSARTFACARCGERQAQGHHHWLPQQHIRVYVRGLRLSGETSRALLRKLLPDERNLIALCDPCHASHELRSRPFAGEEVPHSAYVFALEMGPEFVERLRRLYPSRSAT